MARLLEGHIPDVYSNMAVSSVSIVPSPRDEDKEHFIQGLKNSSIQCREKNILLCLYLLH